MNILEQRFSQLLARRQANGSLRTPKLSDNLVDFSSNDYLSFAQNITLQNRVKLAYDAYISQSNPAAATGSRLLTGHNFLYQQLENQLVRFYNAEAALVVNSGYEANLGLLLACCRKTDLILADELAHASLCDAARWTGAETHFFRHNDIEHLEILLYNKFYYGKIEGQNQNVNVEKIDKEIKVKTEIEIKDEIKNGVKIIDKNQTIKKNNQNSSLTENREPHNHTPKTENREPHNHTAPPENREPQAAIFVLIESVYSMDGDIAKLLEIIELCEKYGAFLLVDEAHATGIFGSGLVAELNLQHRVWARMHTFGKALAAHGAIILGSNLLKQYLLNFARPFIYTTALPPHSLIQISESHHFLDENPLFLTQIKAKIALFQQIMLPLRPLIQLSHSAIQWFSCSSNARANELSFFLRQNGFDIRPILSPTVAAGSERLRICLHLHNTEADFLKLKNLLQSWINS